VIFFNKTGHSNLISEKSNDNFFLGKEIVHHITSMYWHLLACVAQLSFSVPRQPCMRFLRPRGAYLEAQEGGQYLQE
jgi:hypothetical protein